MPIPYQGNAKPPECVKLTTDPAIRIEDDRHLGRYHMALETELATFKNKLSEMIAAGNDGKFVLIHGTDVVDVYGTYEDAIKEGYAKFGLDNPFLVKQIQAVELVQFISRLLDCHTSHAKLQPAG